MCSSWTTPCSSIATRVSCGVTLMRISWLMAKAIPESQARRENEPHEPIGVASDRGTSRVRSEYLQPDLGQNFGGLEKRQPHHSRIAALEMAYECPSPSLDCVGAGLVEGLAGGDIAFDLVIDQRAKCHPRRGDGDQDLCVPADGHRGADSMRWPGAAPQLIVGAHRV